MASRTGLAIRAGGLPASREADSPEDWIALDVGSALALERSGFQPVIPSVFYDVRAYNQIALEIYRSLLNCFSDCDALLARSGVSKYLNLVAVFFHEIQRVLCAYSFKRFELDYIRGHYGMDSGNLATGHFLDCPYVDYDFVLAPKAPGPTQSFALAGPVSRLKQVGRDLRDYIKCIGISPRERRTQRVLYTCGVTADLRRIVQSLNSKESGERWGLRLLSPGKMRIALPHLDVQLDLVKSNLAGLGTCLGLDLSGEISQLLELWIRGHLTGGYADSWSGDVLLTGSPVDRETRLAAARAKSSGIPVVSVFHGESCGVFDEPVFGYGENTFVDRVVGYGEAGCAEAVDGEYLGSLYDAPVVYVASASEKMRQLYSQRGIPCLSKLESPRFMYVPTSLTGTGRYGPYRDLHDVAYLQWQRDLLGHIGQVFPGRVIWKRHCSDQRLASGSIPGVAVVSRPLFEDVLGMADVYIFDYVSTAFSLAAATAKPIIYLDIGLRNLTSPALEALKERCIYVPADPRQPRGAFQQALDLSGKGCTNRYTPSFCLAPEARPRCEVIAEAVLQVANAGRR